MAKSLRSKWRRKMKVIKRVRYGQKELEQLKNIVENAKTNSAEVDKDVTMVDDSIYKVVTRPSRRSAAEPKVCETNEEDKMETGGKLSIYDPVTLKDQNGHYPVWMSSHKRKRLQALNKKQKKEKMKDAKKKKSRRN